MRLQLLTPDDAKEIEVERLHYDPVHQFTAPMLSDTGDSGILLAVAEHGCRVYHSALPVAARWMEQLVPRCTFALV